MKIKLVDSELKVMKVLWREGDIPAKRAAEILREEVGWNVNTTYTLIKRCIKKGALQRSEPHFMCHPLITEEQIQQAETTAFLDKLYDGCADKLFMTLLNSKKLSESQIKKLKDMVSKME